VPDDVWHRVVQIVTNNEELQKYTAHVMFHALEPKHVDETTAKARDQCYHEREYDAVTQ
jgi:AP-2 complex subunit alpha